MVPQKQLLNAPSSCRLCLVGIKISFCLVITIGITLMGVSRFCYANPSDDVFNKVTTQEISVQTNNGLCSLHAEHASLSQVLFSIGKELGFEVRIHGDISDSQQSWSYQAMTLPDMVRNLVRDYSSVMIYQSQDNSSTTNKLSELWVYADNVSSHQSSTPVEIQVQHSLSEEDDFIDARRRTQVAQIDRLKGLQQQDVIDSLAEIVRHEPDPIVRLRAVSALRDIGAGDVLSALEAGMSDASPKVRTEVAHAFGDTKDQRALLFLGQLLMGDKTASVREAAVQSLLGYSSPAAHAFVEAAKQDRDKDVRKAANQNTAPAALH